MTPDRAAHLIDSDRRVAERMAAPVIGRAYAEAWRHLSAALLIGADPFEAIRGPLLGNPALHLRGLAADLAPVLAYAEGMGHKRTRRLVPEMSTMVDKPLALTASPSADYRPRGNWYERARTAAGQAYQSAARVVREGLEAAYRAPSKVRDAVRNVWRKRGYPTQAGEPSRMADVAAEVLVGESYSAGYMGGMNEPEARAVVKGLRHVSILDPGTTPICQPRDGLRLAIDHPYWRTNTPPLHFGCRSVLVPILRDFEPSELIPSIPPAPGFGTAPAFAFGYSFVAA